MFEFVRTHNRLFQVLLFLLIFPSFVFLGLEGYLQSKNHDAVVARVGSSEITQSEWDQALRTQTERMHQQMPTLPTELFNTPSFRRQTLDDLVRQRVVLQAADRLRLYTTDTHLQSVFAADPQFEFLRNPDKTINRTALAAQGMTAEQFEARLRQDISMQQVLTGVAGSSIAPSAATDAALDAMFQQREVRVQRFAVKDYAGKVNPSDEEVQKFYDDPAHEALFKAPESADIQYVMLDLDSVKAGITVPEEELRKNYEQNKSRYVTPEERRASHILIKADKSMSAEDRAKAKAQAEQVLAEVRKNPKSFAELAKKYSADTGSAEKGGDLDFFGRGAMVKPFEDAAFSLKQGEVSGLVQSDFGYHIIMLTAIKPAQERTYEQVRPELLEQARTQLAQQKFAEVAEQFTNTVYEQSDSLQPVADKLKLPIRTAQNVGRSPAAGASAPLNNSKFVNALFGDDALRNKRNTEAVEIGPNQLVSGRITAYRPARKLPFAEVKAKVRDSLVAQQAAEMARKDGEARLAQLKEGKAGTAPVSGEAKVISRVQAQGLPADVISQALAADTAKLPAYVGVNVPGEGYEVVQVDKVLARDPKEADPAAAKAQYAQIFGAAEVQAYYAALKTRQKAEITEAANQPAAESTTR